MTMLASPAGISLILGARAALNTAHELAQAKRFDEALAMLQMAHNHTGAALVLLGTHTAQEKGAQNG